MTQAAEFLSVTQPAVSTLLSNLEAEVGFKLFRRERGRLVTSAEAEAFYEEVERAFAGLEDIRFVRLRDTARAPVAFRVDGVEFTALQGDTILTALRVNNIDYGPHEFTGLPNAGFCLMGACQGCWVEPASS